ncbi:uncharacterized protein ColSpa_06119 [Colletotrichum spaethianum]|uniref:Uncharacterized protein n=1 Tax=Colletotrichum spaethianum TaxID=700344 RepID=A0AA37P266_9PEZI|nr:uncharacterized protein ColSpa_06119 [Colletotrichum spaethianum]GKT45938.1 hypothetical protein ColSpa_06119 [Colletotrichum spaethianum]
MASSFHGDQGSFHDRGFLVSSFDRDAQGANSTSPITNARDLPPSHTYHYPGGIPNGYKMVPAKEGEMSRRYVEDNLPISFYSRKETKAIFSTNNGEVPTRGLSMNHVLVFRELDLWSAEELQERANAIRKKHWRSLKSMPQPECWEDLYDYFDCFDIYFHGAQNLWNLILLLFNENENLSRDKIRATAVYVGILCDEWVQNTENKTKLMAFNCWEGDVVSLITSGPWLEFQKLPFIDVMLVRYTLCYRQDQLLGKPWARPNAYPANTGQLVHDTPSGIPPAVSPSTIIVGGAGFSSSQLGFAEVDEATAATHVPARNITTTKKPIVVSGTNSKHKARPWNLGLAADPDSNNRSEDSFPDNRPMSLTSVPSNRNKATEAPAPHITNLGTIRPGFYHYPMRPYGYAFNTPFMTGSNGEPQPYHGPLGPSAPPAQAVPEQQRYGTRHPVNMTPQKPADNRFHNKGYTSPVQSSTASRDGKRIQPPVYQRTTFDDNPSHKYTEKRNVVVHSAFEQGSGQGSSTGPSRFDTGQDARQEHSKTSSAPGDASHGQPRPRGESRGWEKVPHADESIHGPVFRRSPTKENRPRSYSRASSKGDSYCSNQHPKNGSKYAYTPCTCARCEERERSVYIQLNPAPRIAQDVLDAKIHGIMSRWGKVENVKRLQANEHQGGFVCFFVRFSDGSRVREASATNHFSSDELDCIIRIGAMHHSDYGNAMHGIYGHENDQHGSVKSYNGSQQSAWKGHSSGSSHTQPSSVRRDSRAQVSLEQYMVPRPQLPQVLLAKPLQPPGVHGSAAPPPLNIQQGVPQEILGLVGNITSTCNIPKAKTKPTDTEVLQTSAEAESQSKPPSEEVIPDEEQATRTSSPHISDGSPGKGGNKAIVVNLPATPQKPRKADENTHASDETTAPQDNDQLTTPTKKNPCAPNATTTPKNSSSDRQKESQTTTEIAPRGTTTTENSKAVPAQSQSESSYAKGKYRKIFSQNDDLSIEHFDAPVIRMGARHDSSAMSSSSVEERFGEQIDEPRTRAGHEFDNLIDSNQNQDAVHMMILVENSTKKKSNKKPKKKKKAPACANQGEPSSTQQPARDTPINATEKQAPDVPMPLDIEAAEDIDPATLMEVIAKAKRIVAVKEAGSTSTKQIAIDSPANAVPQALVPPVAETAESNTLEATKDKEIFRSEDNDPKNKPEKSDVQESINKSFRANGGGSLRLPKNRKKQPAQLHFADREPSASGGTAGNSSFEALQFTDTELPSAASTAHFSSTTDQEGRSTDGSPGMLSTPATPPSARAVLATPSSSLKEPAAGAEATPKSKILLNPKAKEFVSPTALSTAAAPKKIELAPVPLKPTIHHRNVSQTSSKTSRTLTPGNSPAKEEDNQSDGNAVESSKGKEKSLVSQQGFAMDRDAKSPAVTDGAQVADQQTSGKDAVEMDKNHSCTGEDLPVSQSTPDDDGDWQVQRPKRDFSTKQPKGNSQQTNHKQQQSKQGQQGPKKNRPSPKKQEKQGQSHLQQQRYASSPNTNPVSVGSKAEFPSLPPAPKPVTGLPASSVWGKARSVSTAATASTPNDSITAHKGETASPDCKKDSGKQ